MKVETDLTLRYEVEKAMVNLLKVPPTTLALHPQGYILHKEFINLAIEILYRFNKN